METSPSSGNHYDLLLDKMLLEITELHWTAALDLYTELGNPDDTAKQLRRLALNMLTAQKFRSLLYGQLTTCIEQGQLNVRCKPEKTPHGWETVALIECSIVKLDSPSNEPRAQATQKVRELHPILTPESAVALAGIQDGYLISAMTHLKGTVSGDRRPPVRIDSLMSSNLAFVARRGLFS